MTPVEIVHRVCVARGIPLLYLRAAGKPSWAVSRARWEACWLLRQHTDLGLKAIVRAVYRTNHTSALHGIRKIAAEVERSETYRDELNAILGPRTFAEALARAA